MGVTCELLLKNRKDVYRAGDSVEGTVKYVIDEPTEFNRITVSLKGKGLCYWVPITSNTKYTESENYVNQRMDLLQAKENESVSIPAGTYEKEFSFALPDEIPSSHKDFRCFISFFIQLEFIEPNSMDLSKKFYLDIHVRGGTKSRLEENYPVYQIKKHFTLSKNTITLLAGIKKPFSYAGEDIEVVYLVINEAGVPLVASKAEIMEYTTYKSNGNHIKQKSKILKGLEMKYIGINRLKSELKQTHYFSTTPDIFSIDSNMLKKDYKAKITLKFPFPHRELCLEIPVVIAEKREGFEEKKLDDEPPSYWQAMNEKSNEGID